MSDSKNNKNLKFFSAAIFLLLFSAVTGAEKLSEYGDGKPTSLSPETHAVLRSLLCKSTVLYPDLCHSAEGFTSANDFMAALLNVITTVTRRNYSALKAVAMRMGKMAVGDCLVAMEVTLDDLHTAVDALIRFYTNDKSLLRRAADDLNILISSAMAYQKTCLDSFFNNHDANELVGDEFSDRLVHVEHLCSAALAMIKKATEAHDKDNSELKERVEEAAEAVIGEGLDGDGWPLWLSRKDRWLLETTSETKPDSVVAADGSGDFTTLAEAVEAVPDRNNQRYVIKIKAGVYREEYVQVPSNKKYVMLIGDGWGNTIITGDRSVKGTPNTSTFNSSTLAAVGDHFMARDITFQNTAGPENEQAVALRVGSDKSAFYRCGFIAYQDTLYVHTKRNFFVKCYVAGTVDFIFGFGAAIFQNCDIHARQSLPKKKNMITAHGRRNEDEKTGIVIHKCRIGATLDLLLAQNKTPTYLGRPWGKFSRTVVMQSEISDVIQPEGWFPWNGSDHLDTLTYREYNNTGPGANTDKRVTWKGFKVIAHKKEAEYYTAGRFIDGSRWLPDTGFPFELGL